MRMDLERLKVFYVVAKEGGLLKASLKLNLTQPSLSRTIRLLEEELGTQLFDRTGKGLRLTSQGERALEFAEKTVQDAELFERLLNDQSDSPQGVLKIVTTPAVATTWLAEYVPGFLKLYPQIRLNIVGAVDPSEQMENADILIRTKIDHHPHLIQRLVHSVHHKLWASPEYLQEYGSLQRIEDLDLHRLLTFETTKINSYANNIWILELGAQKDKPRKPYLVINSIDGLINYAERGLGIIGVPEEHLALRHHTLVNILPQVEGPSIELYCIYDEKMQRSKRVTLFADYLEQKVNQTQKPIYS